MSNPVGRLAWPSLNAIRAHFPNPFKSLRKRHQSKFSASSHAESETKRHKDNKKIQKTQFIGLIKKMPDTYKAQKWITFLKI